MMSTQFFMASSMLSVLFYIFYQNPQSVEILTSLINLKAFSRKMLLKRFAKSLECQFSTSLCLETNWLTYFESMSANNTKTEL